MTDTHRFEDYTIDLAREDDGTYVAVDRGHAQERPRHSTTVTLRAERTASSSPAQEPACARGAGGHT